MRNIYIFFLKFRDVDFEIVVVDDGSPDGTQDIVKQLQSVYGEDRIVSTNIYFDFVALDQFSSSFLLFHHNLTIKPSAFCLM